MKKKVIKNIVFLFTLIVLLTGAVPVSAASQVKLNKTKITLNVKKSYQLKLTGNKKKVKWSTSKKSVATVNKNGKVTAKKKGTATITAKVGNKKYKCKVTVRQPVTSVKLNKKSVTLKKKNATVKLKVTVGPKGANNKKVKWSTSNKNVVTVTQGGVVKAIGNGTCIVSVMATDGSKKKATCKVTVKGLPKSSNTGGSGNGGNTGTSGNTGKKEDAIAVNCAHAWQPQYKTEATYDYITMSARICADTSGNFNYQELQQYRKNGIYVRTEYNCACGHVFPNHDSYATHVHEMENIGDPRSHSFSSYDVYAWRCDCGKVFAPEIGSNEAKFGNQSTLRGYNPCYDQYCDHAIATGHNYVPSIPVKCKTGETKTLTGYKCSKCGATK